MPNYLCIQRSQKRTSDTPPPEKPTPEKMQKMMNKFRNWQDKYQSQIVDTGGPLAGGAKVVTSESIDEAAQIAQESPGVMAPGSSVEVREIKSMQD